MITIEEVKKIAVLSRIELNEKELEKFQNDLSSVLSYVEELKQVEVAGIEIVSQVTGLENVQRKDVAVRADNQKQLIELAPSNKDGYYQVKSIL